MSKCVRRTRDQGLHEETERPKRFHFLFRWVLNLKSKNRVNERVSSIPAPRPVLQPLSFHSASILRRYKMRDHMHTGWDSEIYVGERRIDCNEVAIKISEKSQEREAERHRALFDDDAPVGVPCIYSYELFEDSQKTYLITELLGSSLHDILGRLENRRMRVKDVCMIAVRAISCLEYFHGRGVIHGDINPKSILMGRLDKRTEMFLIDYKSLQPWGLHGKRIPCEEAGRAMRNPHYGSPRSCSSRILTRRDDMISLSYIVIELFKGELPWVNIDEINECRRVDRMKEQAGKGGGVCAGLPKEIVDFIKRVHDLEYSEIPDYNALVELFMACLRGIGETFDDVYEWFDNVSTSL